MAVIIRHAAPQLSLIAYGWSGWTGRDNHGNPSTSLNTSTYNITDTPLYLLRSGFVNHGSFTAAGDADYHWSSIAVSASYAYGLDFNPSDVYPSSNHARFHGYSVRCVAR